MKRLLFKLEVPVSYLPFRVLRLLGRTKVIWRLGYDPVDGWNFWIQADYRKYARQHQPSS